MVTLNNDLCIRSSSPESSILEYVGAALRAQLPLSFGSACILCNETDPCCLPASEQEAVQYASQTRRKEFTAGRIAARTALHQIGVEESIILSGDDRAPRWPSGIVGSIAHANGLAIAAVAPILNAESIGIDLEVTDALDPNLWPEILSDKELRAVEAQGQKYAREAAAAIFAIKESYFKFQYPLSKEWIDFHSVTVHFDSERKTWCLHAQNALRIKGRLCELFNARVKAVSQFTIASIIAP